MLRSSKRGKYIWKQVFGHTAATHGYESRIPNERRGVTEAEKYSYKPTTEQPGNIRGHLATARENNRMYIRIEASKIIWICGYYNEEFETEKGVATNIEKYIKKRTKESSSSPYCPGTFNNLINLTTHLLKQGSANKPDGRTKTEWKDIVKANNIENPKVNSNNNENRKDTSNFAKMGILFSRINITNDEDGVHWDCNQCTYTAYENNDYETIYPHNIERQN